MIIENLSIKNLFNNFSDEFYPKLSLPYIKVFSPSIYIDYHLLNILNRY